MFSNPHYITNHTNSNTDSLTHYPSSIATSFTFIIQQLLHHIKNGDLNKIEYIFNTYSKQKIDEYWKVDNFDFLSPIHEAAECGRNRILKYLLSPSIGFDMNELTSHGSHILHLAAYRGKVSTVKLLIDEYGISPEIRTTESECTPLILASRNGHEIVVRLLIERYGVDVNVSDNSGSTALHRASGWNQTHIIDYLVRFAGADLEIKRNDDGYTSLMLAGYYNKWESIDLLLDLGANIENVSYDECTPAHIAMERNNYKALYYLVCRGADIDRICKGCTVRNMADYTFELKQCIGDGLMEYNKYYQQITVQLNKELTFKLLCDDVIQTILDMTYPQPILRKDSNKNVKDKKRKHLETAFPPNKKQRIH